MQTVPKKKLRSRKNVMMTSAISQEAFSTICSVLFGNTGGHDLVIVSSGGKLPSYEYLARTWARRHGYMYRRSRKSSRPAAKVLNPLEDAAPELCPLGLLV